MFEQILNESSDKIILEMKEQLTKVLSKTSAKGKKYTSITNASGATSNSITQQTSQTKTVIYAFQSILYTSQGRKSGGVPPTDAIRNWIIAKGIDSNPEAKLVNAIKWSIARNGTNPDYSNVLAIANTLPDIVLNQLTNQPIKTFRLFWNLE